MRLEPQIPERAETALPPSPDGTCANRLHLPTCAPEVVARWDRPAGWPPAAGRPAQARSQWPGCPASPGREAVLGHGWLVPINGDCWHAWMGVFYLCRWRCPNAGFRVCRMAWAAAPHRKGPGEISLFSLLRTGRACARPFCFHAAEGAVTSPRTFWRRSSSQRRSGSPGETDALGFNDTGAASDAVTINNTVNMFGLDTFQATVGRVPSPGDLVLRTIRSTTMAKAGLRKSEY